MSGWIRELAVQNRAKSDPKTSAMETSSSTANTHVVRIYISGPVQLIEQVCREECCEDPICVTVEPTKFIYTRGEESGAVVGLLNYPRFPKNITEINTRARRLAENLLARTFQRNVLIVTPTETELISII